jgi:death-on-curing protein
LLNAALVRPQTHVFGHDAYPTMPEKAAALLYSLTVNHGLIDGNKRLALAAVLAFGGINGQRPTLTNEQAYHLVMGVASGELELAEITAVLRHGGVA